MNQRPLTRSLALLLLPLSAGVILASVQAPVSPWHFVAGVAELFVAMLLLAAFCRDKQSLVLAVLLAVLIRVAFLFFFPAAIDVNRYIWEGTIQLQGFNPFTVTPNSLGSAGLPDVVWQGVIFRDMTAIYLPFAELLFRATTAFSQEPLAMKLVMTLFDCATIGLLAILAHRRGLPQRFILLYALNPLVLVCISGQGHLESVVVLLLLAALTLAESRRYRYLAYTALGCAILTKIYAIVVLPFFLRKLGLRPLLFLLLPLLLFLFYPADIADYFTTTTAFATNFSHNGLLHLLLRDVFGLEHTTSLLLLAAILTGALATIFLLTPSLLRACCLATGLLLLCLPTVHPWYFLLFTPYLVFFRQWSWLSLHLSSLLLIFYFNPAISPPFFHHRGLLFTLEYLPFVTLLLIEHLRERRHWPAAYPEPVSVSVIIPARNEETQIAGCLESVRAQGLPCEIIVVDGGSTDRTREKVAEIPGVLFYRSPPGRGVQIACGVSRASGDCLVVLHADSRLKQGALQRMLAALRQHPEAAGGAMQAIYDSPSVRFRLIALLNNLRARCSGISFGDQAQFFRRAALPEGFPAFRLMEDVELSLRMKEHGTLLFIPDGVTASTRRWTSTGYFANSLMVIRLTGTFLLLRSFGLIRDKGEWFYQHYYKKA